MAILGFVPGAGVVPFPDGQAYQDAGARQPTPAEMTAYRGQCAAGTPPPNIPLEAYRESARMKRISDSQTQGVSGVGDWGSPAEQEYQMRQEREKAAFQARADAAARERPHSVNTTISAENPMISFGNYQVPRDVYYGIHGPNNTPRYAAAKNYLEGVTGVRIGGGDRAAPGVTGSVTVDAQGRTIPNYGRNTRATYDYSGTTPMSLLAGSVQKMPFTPESIRTVQVKGEGARLAIPTNRLADDNPWDTGILNTRASARAMTMAATLVRERPGFDASMGLTMQENAANVQRYEKLRREAAARGDFKAQAEYSRKEQAAAQNLNELSRAYHQAGKTMGIAIASNPYEALGDLGIEFMRGTPVRDSERFSPISGELINVLPLTVTKVRGVSVTHGLGLQADTWNAAMNRERGLPNVVNDFGPAASYIETAAKTGYQGPYGDLYGGKNWQGTTVDRPLGPSVGGGSIGVLVTPDYTKKPVQMVALTDGSMFPAPYKSVSRSAQDITKQPDLPRPGAGMVLPAPFLSSYAGRKTEPGVVTKTTPTGLGTFQGVPVVGIGKYTGGGAPRATSTIDDMFETALTLGKVEAVRRSVSTFGFGGFYQSIYRGLDTVQAKHAYEREAAATEREVSPLVKRYETDLGKYNVELAQYNAKAAVYEMRRAAYETNKTEPEYRSLLEMESGLTARQAFLESSRVKLETQKSVIDQKVGNVTALQEKYAAKAYTMVSGRDPKTLTTYGLGSWITGLGEKYTDVVEKPIGGVTKDWGMPGQFISGVATTPRVVTDIGSMLLIGGEGIIRQPKELPGLVASGAVMQAKGIGDMAATNPAGLVGMFVGMFALGYVASSAGTKGVGLIRSRGKGYIPIENIGYEAKYGYPIAPKSTTSADLIRGFEEGRLYPKPMKMSRTEIVPYLHGEGGIPLARLPNAPKGNTVLWTAHESESLTGGTKVGQAYKMTQTGSSELDSISAAPILEGYFTKVGGQIPKAIGFDNPIKTPTAYATTVQGLETIPASVKARLPKNAQGKYFDYTVVNEYMQARLTEVPGGQGFVPLLKAEYEANIATGSIFEVTGRNYYTKLGGFGKSHFLGTRVPIIEQDLIGFEPAGVVSKIPVRTSGSSYKQAPLINLYYSAPSVVSPAAVSARLPTERAYVRSSRTTPYHIEDSIVSPTESRVYRSRANSYARQYYGEPEYGSYVSSSKGALSVSPLSTQILKVSLPYSKPVSSRIASLSLMTTALTPPRSPVTSGSTTKITPPYSPFSPVPPTTPVVPIPLWPGGLQAGNAAAHIRRSRKKKWMETFRTGFKPITQSPLFAGKKKSAPKAKPKKKPRRRTRR